MGFYRKQTKDMKKIAQMKYGEDTDEMVLYDIEKLGQAVAIYDLLKVKHANAIPVGNVVKQSCSAKGAVFILYNVARVQRVLNTFNEKVASGYYTPLPELDQIDVSLLKEEVGVETFQFSCIHKVKRRRLISLNSNKFYRKNGSYYTFIYSAFHLCSIAVFVILNVVRWPCIHFVIF